MRFLTYSVRGEDLAYGETVLINPYEVASIMCMDSGRAMVCLKNGDQYIVQESARVVKSDIESAYSIT
jgi:uncharacterized protein YlzI (FlbEa/FlbD family)